MTGTDPADWPVVEIDEDPVELADDDLVERVTRPPAMPDPEYRDTGRHHRRD